MKLTEVKQGLLVKMLKEKTIYQAGLEFGLDKHYKDSNAMKSAIYQVYRKAKVNPEKFGLTQETIDEVASAIKNRIPAGVSNAQDLRTAQDTTLREKLDNENHKDIKDLVLGGRRKALELVFKKMDRIGRSNKGIDDANLSTLAQTFGILFDKAQIIQGEATENVAVLAKIDTNMKPEDALKAVLGMREFNNIEKDRTTKKK